MREQRRRLNDRWITEQIVKDNSGDAPISDEKFACVKCGAPDSRCYYNRNDPCFNCSKQTVGLVVLIDAGGEDSPHPARIADGTAHINLGLPPVATGRDSEGRYTCRPVTNQELGSNYGVREYAKRHGVEPMTRGRYRGLR